MHIENSNEIIHMPYDSYEVYKRLYKVALLHQIFLFSKL